MRIARTTLTDRIRALPARLQAAEDTALDWIAENPVAAGLCLAAALGGWTLGAAAVHLLFPALIAAGWGL